MTHTEKAALGAVRDFLDCYSQKDVKGCMSALSATKPILLLGTNENEVFRSLDDVRSALMRDFGSMNNIRWGEYRNLHVDADSTLASVLVELPISFQSNGQQVETMFRYALTLTKEGEQWKICSGLASVPFKAGTYTFPE